MKPSVAILLGSARSEGNTAKLVSALTQNIGAKVYDLRRYQIKAFDYDFANQEDDFQLLMNQLLEYPIILFASPVYWYAPSAQVKIFIDRLSDFLKLDALKDKGRILRSKYTGVIATSASPELEPSFASIFDNTFRYLGMTNIGSLFRYCENEPEISPKEPAIVEFSDKIEKVVQHISGLRSSKIQVAENTAT
ncbi:flavodoxin family protein [Aliikangiella sp. G2MR2-5]|uniref:flavodoxin family protein n=1 Tax=Aliikangiella sp. G2MR2-5 TaxID=2788943 RepID=UPI0018ABF8C4|nr:NAD(P)H-dependent oxidoreductase [Aliikangiella sp. G2MR2-5]